MKRNLLGVFAVVLAIALSSFSVRFGTMHYLVYKGVGNADNSLNSYTPQLGVPTADAGTNFLYYIKIEDHNGTTNIQSDEFDEAFDVLDADGDNDLDDQSETSTTYTIPGIPGSADCQLEKRTSAL